MEIEPFEERVDRLFRELELAIRFDRPSILLAVYQSEIVRDDAEAALAAKLRDLNQATIPYRISGEENADAPMALAQHPQRKQAVFYISGLRWGGGRDGRNAYRALNFRREYFVDYRLRAVLWLTEQEAIALPRHAPDFWAFRHRTVEFVEPPAPERVVPQARELAWRDFEDRTLREDTEAKIELRQTLLRDLPEGDESLAARADLLYTLAGLHWAKGEYEQAIELWQQALSLYERMEDTPRQARCHNGRGNVYHDLGRYEEALEAYGRAIELDPKYASPHNGRGNVYRDLGRHEEALEAYGRAIELDPNLVQPHYNLARLEAVRGNREAALEHLEQAVALDGRWRGYAKEETDFENLRGDPRFETLVA